MPVSRTLGRGADKSRRDVWRTALTPYWKGQGLQAIGGDSPTDRAAASDPESGSGGSTVSAAFQVLGARTDLLMIV